MVPQRPATGNVPLEHSTALECGRARAAACADVAEPLRELLQHAVSDWEQHGFERIKERTVRSVFRGRLGGVPVHVKVFRADKLADRARDAVRTPRGEREAANLLKARVLGLPAVEPLAYGIAVDRDQQRSFVVTRTADEAAQFTFAAPADALRRTGQLLRRIHDSGVRPADLHQGNLLLDAGVHPILLDLTSVRHGGEPSLAERANGLAVFCQQLDGGALDPAARELLGAYLAAGPSLPTDLRGELVLATRRWRARALLAFGRRAERDCLHTEVMSRRRGQPQWFWRREAANADVRARCEEIAASPGEPLRQGRRGAVWLTDDLACKRRERGAARRLWHAGYWLSFAGVPIADPVALCLRHDAGLVFARRAPGRTLADELAAGAADATAVATAARELGRSVGRLHAHGLRNRDLKFENLVRDPASGVIRAVDLDGVRRGAANDHRGQGRDLGRLLAAFRAAGSPGGAGTVSAFVRAYLRSHLRLLQRPPLLRIARRAEQRAAEWASAHR
jgi:tRNA A-37 threonylcarbamoyl transferase component Bud32